MNDEFSNLITSVIRTVVPMIVGWVATVLLQIGVEIDSASLAAFLTTLLSSLYYVLARWVETRFPFLRFLLGAASKPSYQ